MESRSRIIIDTITTLIYNIYNISKLFEELMAQTVCGIYFHSLNIINIIKLK